jgi:RNA ligase (TIGR02306 family)
MKSGDLVTFVPPDSVIPTDLADKLGFRHYLRGTNHDRVGVTKIRGVVSYGLVLPSPSYVIGSDVAGCLYVEGDDAAEFWGITKYEPPIRPVQGTPREKDLTFPEYIDIENFKHFKDCFQPGEDVIVTEKIDGTNCRVGVTITETGCVLKAGSHRVNRDDPGEELWAANTYWFPHTLTSIQCMFGRFVADGIPDKIGDSLIIYGEVFGAVRGGLKSMHYGSPNQLQFRAFAAMRNYTWMTPGCFFDMCKEYNIPTVPVLYHGPYVKDTIEELLNKPSEMAEMLGSKQIKEGVVIQSAVNPLKILKLLNPEYLLLKNKAEDKGEYFDVKDE